MSGDRVFTDGMTEVYFDRIQASAQKRYGKSAEWFRCEQISEVSRKRYTVRRLGIRGEGEFCIATARVNRGGAVHWRTPWTNETWIPEEPSP